MTQQIPGPVSPVASPVVAKAPKASKARKEKCTFMLHDPNDLSSLGKYQSTDFRYAALKVASRGHKSILLRKTNTKEMREFTGDVVALDVPKEIHRGDRVIKYTKRPVVKFVKKWTFEGQIDDDDELPLANVK